VLLALWSAYEWIDTTPPVITQTKGGISEREYKRYRRHIEAVLKASDKREFEKYNKSVKALEEIATEANIEIPRPIARISETKKIEYVLPDYYITTLALQELLNYIVKLREQRIQDYLDDDILIMMLTS
jgi:hypothetical protein